MTSIKVPRSANVLSNIEKCSALNSKELTGSDMSKVIIAIAGSWLTMLLASGVSASYYSGKGVIANCGSDATYDNGWCAGYLGSWADGDIDMVRRKACIQYHHAADGVLPADFDFLLALAAELWAG